MPVNNYKEAWTEAYNNAPHTVNAINTWVFEFTVQTTTTRVSIYDGDSYDRISTVSGVDVRYATARLEKEAELAAGAAVPSTGKLREFINIPFRVTLPKVGENQKGSASITLAPNPVVLQALATVIKERNIQLNATFRQFQWASRMTGPATALGMVFSVSSVTASDAGIEFSFTPETSLEVAFPGVVYDTERFPGLVT